MNKIVKYEELKQIIEDVRNLVKEEQKVKGLKCSTTDEFLLRFIKASSYDVEVSFQLIRRYFKIKIEEPECFVVDSPAKYLQAIQRTDINVPLKDYDKCGRRILHVRFGNVDPRVDDWITIIQSGMMILETYSLQSDVQDSGLALILNCENFSLKIMKWATPSKLKVMAAFLQECVPIRFEVIHVVNYPVVFNVFFSAIKPFMYETVRDKFVWHSNLDALHEFIDRGSLPIDLGGYLEGAELKDFYKDILGKEKVFDELRQMGYKK